MRVEADLDLCQGHQECRQEAPEVFGFDEDTDQVVVLQRSRAIMHRATTAPVEPGDFWYSVFDHVRTLGEKDLGFALDLAGELDVDVPLARCALDRLGPGLGLTENANREAL